MSRETTPMRRVWRIEIWSLKLCGEKRIELHRRCNEGWIDGCGGCSVEVAPSGAARAARQCARQAAGAGRAVP